VVWLPACKDVSLETEEPSPSEAITEHRDREHWFVSNGDL
jgi:hypothetical protein